MSLANWRGRRPPPSGWCVAHRSSTLPARTRPSPRLPTKLGCGTNVVRKWFKRFSVQGLAGLNDAPRSGAPSRYTPENRAHVVATARTRPSDLGLPFGSWTFERLATYLHEVVGLPLKKTRIFEILQEEGLRWRRQETWFGERLDPAFAEKRGASKRSARTIRRQRHPEHRRNGASGGEELSWAGSRGCADTVLPSARSKRLTIDAAPRATSLGHCGNDGRTAGRSAIRAGSRRILLISSVGSMTRFQAEKAPHLRDPGQPRHASLP